VACCCEFATLSALRVQTLARPLDAGISAFIPVSFFRLSADTPSQEKVNLICLAMAGFTAKTWSTAP